MSISPDIRPSQEPNPEEQPTYFLKQTADGKPYVGMQIGDKNYVLVTAKVERIAEPFITLLKEKYKIEALSGKSYDWRTSIEEKKLKPIDIEDVRVLGVYIPEDKFENFLNLRAFIRNV